MTGLLSVAFGWDVATVPPAPAAHIGPASQPVSLARPNLAAAGGALFAPAVTRRLVERFTAPDRDRERPAGLDELTPRELDVLRLIARGLSNAEIAAELVVSEHTTKSHVASVLSKLRLRSRVQAVVVAYESGLVTPGAG
jgi:DNA-binding NarL/FixJ family response regulator